MHSSTAALSRFNWLARPLPRAQRRTLVIAMYALFVGFVGTMYAAYTSDPRWPAPLAVFDVLLFGATAVTFIRVVTSPGYAADSVDRALPPDFCDLLYAADETGDLRRQVMRGRGLGVRHDCLGRERTRPA